MIKEIIESVNVDKKLEEGGVIDAFKDLMVVMKLTKTLQKRVMELVKEKKPENKDEMFEFFQKLISMVEEEFDKSSLTPETKKEFELSFLGGMMRKLKEKVPGELDNATMVKFINALNFKNKEIQTELLKRFK